MNPKYSPRDARTSHSTLQRAGRPHPDDSTCARAVACRPRRRETRRNARTTTAGWKQRNGARSTCADARCRRTRSRRSCRTPLDFFVIRVTLGARRLRVSRAQTHESRSRASFSLILPNPRNRPALRRPLPPPDLEEQRWMSRIGFRRPTVLPSY